MLCRWYLLTAQAQPRVRLALAGLTSKKDLTVRAFFQPFLGEPTQLVLWAVSDRWSCARGRVLGECWGVALPLEAALNNGVGVVLLGLWCCVAQLDSRQARFGVTPHACAVCWREKADGVEFLCCADVRSRRFPRAWVTAVYPACPAAPMRCKAP